jgi:8-oxo-dGTP diphosphatase
MLQDAKKTDAWLGWLLVVAGALIDAQGRILMHQRPEGKMYAGLWEFPGGKVEGSEKPVQSLVRELHEELGIRLDPDSVRPAGFAEDGARQGRLPIVLLLYTVTSWHGAPQALEGGKVVWCAPHEVLALPMPPLDRQLAAGLIGANLPDLRRDEARSPPWGR